MTAVVLVILLFPCQADRPSEDRTRNSEFGTRNEIRETQDGPRAGDSNGVPIPGTQVPTSDFRLPTSPIPPKDEFGLPAPPWVFEILLPGTFLFHIVFMNLALGTAVFAVPFHRAARTRPYLEAVTVRLFRYWPIHVSLTITTGVAPLLFVQLLYGHAFYTANILLGWTWLAILGLLLPAFYAIYLIQKLSVRGDGAGGYVLRPPTWVVTALCLLVAAALLMIAAIFTANSTLMLAPAAWKEVHAGASAFSIGGMLWPRFLHNVIGALAVTGLGVAVVARTSRAMTEDHRRSAVSLGLLLAAIFTLAQFATGVWFLVAIWTDAAAAFHEMSAGTILWGLAILAALVASPVMFRSLERPERPASVWLPVGLIALTLLGMSAGRERVRHGMLRNAAVDLYSSQDVRAQPIVMAAFVLALVAGLAVVFVMLRWTRSAGAETDTQRS